MNIISNVNMDDSINNNLNGSSNSNSNTKPNNRCNLIVNYLPQSLKEHDFNLLFSKIGPIKTCKLMFDRQTGYSFGYGFVEYVNEEDALKAIDTFNGYQIEHKRLKVALARPNCEDTKNTNLYIRNIPLTFDEQHLHDLFSQYGEVVQVRILRDQNTTFTRRIGFVIMATKQMAQTAIQHLDNTIPPNGGSEPIYVKYADEEGKKRHGPSGNNNANIRMNQHGLINQNNYQNNYQNPNNYLQQQQGAHGFNLNNPNPSFMMTNNNQNPLNTLVPNNLANLGKVKTNRSNGHQNRYNPISGAAAGMQGGPNTNNAGLGGNYNPWNMTPTVMQPPYSNFGTTGQNNIIGNSGFPENLINTIGAGGTGGGNSGAGGGRGGGSYNTNISNSNAALHPNFNQQHHVHPHQQNHQLQQQHFSTSSSNSYLNISNAQAAAAAMTAVAVTGIGNNSTNNNLIDVTGMGIGNNNIGNIPMDISKPNNLGNMPANGNNGHIIYVYGIGQANESDLYSLFSNCGRILRVNVIKNQKTGHCKGYGFVVFETYEEAFYAVHNMNGYMYNHRPLQVSFKSFQNTTTNNNNNKNKETKNNSLRNLDNYNSNFDKNMSGINQFY